MQLHTTKHTFAGVGPNTVSVRDCDGMAVPAGFAVNMVRVTTSARGVPCSISPGLSTDMVRGDTAAAV